MLTLALVAASVLAVWIDVREYIAEGRTVYLTNKTLLLLEIEGKQAAFQRGVINAEMIWRTKFMPQSQLVPDFARNNGRLIIRASNKEVSPQLALGVITPEHPASSSA